MSPSPTTEAGIVLRALDSLPGALGLQVSWYPTTEAEIIVGEWLGRTSESGILEPKLSGQISRQSPYTIARRR